MFKPKAAILLTRDQFREGVFNRDMHKCVVCGNPAQDAHHILERRLFPDGGYYLDNGASLCGPCHIKAEETTISPEELRLKIGITRAIIPEYLYDDQIYDKWGNIVLANGTRLKGDLFYDESVQKVLQSGGVLHLFTNLVKYPRTHHLPNSPGIHDDDRMLEDYSNFEHKRVIIQEKMDGENSSLYRNAIHARSVDSQNHPSRNWLKNFWGQMRWDIPEDWRICGENMYQVHSIKYQDLESYFYGFSIWNERNVCLSFEDTIEWFTLLGITQVPVLYDGIFDLRVLNQIVESMDTERTEGFVIRIADAFNYGAFRHSVAKWVRKDHIQTVKHWKHGQLIEPNGLGNHILNQSS